MSSSIVSPFPFFTDTTGAPLEGGYIYIGQSNLNPETAPINVFWDSALTIPAGQPIRTVGGYPSRAGTASRMYVSADTYSITVRNKNRVLVFSAFDQSDSPGTVFDISTQLITAVAAQISFVLTTFAYLPGTDTLEVYRNGLRLNLNLDYIETNSSVVTLTSPANAGDQFLFQGGTVITGNQVPGSQVTFTQAGTGAITRNIQDKARESVSVKDFGAVGDGVTDDTAAIQAALNASACVRIPTGTYKISGTLTLTKDGATILGDSFQLSVLTSSSTTAPMISINGGLNGVNIQGIKLTRSVTATGGADGINCSSVSIGQSYIGNILVEKQSIGLHLGATDYSLIEKVISQKNTSCGVRITTTATDGAVQWSINGLLCQKNGAQGLLVQSASGPAQMTLGSYRNVNTYANTGTGIAFAGIGSCPIQGVRINGAFAGEDANSEIYLNTYGGQHQISNVFAELAGRGSTGPTLSTPLSNIGSGFEVTSNNVDVLFTGCHSNGNSLDGFFVAGNDCVISGCRATNNGIANVSGRKNGINVASGFAVVVSSSRSGNTGAGASQLYGVFAADGNNVTIGSCDLRNNATATVGATANSNYFSLFGNLPNTSNTIIPVGALLVGGGATGGASIPGGINVAAGIAKNNVAYVNP